MQIYNILLSSQPSCEGAKANNLLISKFPSDLLARWHAFQERRTLRSCDTRILLLRSNSGVLQKCA